MVLNVLGHCVAEIETVFDKRGGRGCALRRAESNAIDSVIAFDLDPRNPEIDVVAGRDLIEVEPREIDAKFIHQGGRESAYKRECLHLIERLDAEVALWTVAPGVVGGYLIFGGEVGAVRELVASKNVIEAPIVLVAPVGAWNRERYSLNVRNPIKTSAGGIAQRNVLTLCPHRRT